MQRARKQSLSDSSHAAVHAGAEEPCHPDRQGPEPAAVDQVRHPPPGGAEATPPQTAQHACCMLLWTCRHCCQLLRLMLRGAGCRGGWLGERRRAVPVPRLKPRCWHMLDSSFSVLSCERGTAPVYSAQAVSGRHRGCMGFKWCSCCCAATLALITRTGEPDSRAM